MSITLTLVVNGQPVGDTGITALVSTDGLVIGIIEPDKKPQIMTRLRKPTTLDRWAGLLEASIQQTGNCRRAAEVLFAECGYLVSLHDPASFFRMPEIDE